MIVQIVKSKHDDHHQKHNDGVHKNYDDDHRQNYDDLPKFPLSL